MNNVCNFTIIPICHALKFINQKNLLLHIKQCNFLQKGACFKRKHSNLKKNFNNCDSTKEFIKSRNKESLRK